METFIATGLREAIVRALVDLGYEKPTPIQAQAIPAILGSDRDLIALAQTGTGKTAAYGLPIIEMVDTALPVIQALILAPTRELAIQITNDLEGFARYLKDLRITAVYGGAHIGNQIRALQQGTHIVAGTPGRVLDLINRGELDVSLLRYLVLDEADEMLNMGFQADLDAILAGTPQEKQTLLFSATMAAPVAQIARRYMHQPQEIAVGTRNAGASNVEHFYYLVNAADRYAALRRIADMHEDMYGIIFCRTRRETQEIANKLGRDGYPADALYGDLTQSQRDGVMERFRSRQIQMLVATDVAARGLDIDDLTHVINYELPDDPEVYVHRSGRTGRAGKSGISLSLVHTRETRKLVTLERMTGKPFARKPVPNGEEICEQKLRNRIERIVAADIEDLPIDHFLPTMYEMLADLSREELIQRFIAMEFGQLLEHYRNAPDLNIKQFKPGGTDRNDGPQQFTGFYINVGYRNKLNPARLMGLINGVMRQQRVRIGKIDINNKMAYFEIESRFAAKLPQAFHGTWFEGVQVAVQLATGAPSAQNNDDDDDRKRRYKPRKK
ncbi:MAG: DEAD/DEAH box helicase [Bacteroidia bacterium]